MTILPTEYCQNCGRQKKPLNQCFCNIKNIEIQKTEFEIKQNVDMNEKTTEKTISKLISFEVKSYEDKEKLVSALTNNGYIVGAELEKDKTASETLGWRVDVYAKE